jgi:hypothetical protein
MPRNKSRDLITDQEIVFARLILSGTVTDHRAAEIAGLNPATAAYSKAKPRIQDYMRAHRAEGNARLAQQQTEDARQQNLGRERVLTRLWEIANMDPERTRNSVSAQMRALSMIVAIEALIPDRRSPAQNRPASQPLHPQSNTAAGLRDQQAKTTSPGPVHEDGFGVAANAPSDLSPVPGPAPENLIPSSVQKKPDTWRLRL